MANFSYRRKIPSSGWIRYLMIVEDKLNVDALGGIWEAHFTMPKDENMDGAFFLRRHVTLCGRDAKSHWYFNRAGILKFRTMQYPGQKPFETKTTDASEAERELAKKVYADSLEKRWGPSPP